MASRLSEDSLRAVYDTGHQGLAIQSSPSLDLLTGPSVDLDKLLLTEDPEAAVQAVAPQALYQALLMKGPEDALDVLQHMSQDQVVRLFDYDVWSEDRLVPLKAIRWLTLFRENGPEELFKRFQGLDEEYQLALVGPFVKVYDEDEYEKLSQPEQDAVNRMPCGTLFYRVNSEDPRIEEFLTGLFEAIMGTDINYAYSVLTHAGYLPPNEQEEQIARFRKARLEEDGFVAYEDSLAAFRPLDLDELKRRWSFLLGRDEIGLTAARASGDLFLLAVLKAGATTWQPAVFEQVSRGFAALSNTLAAAAKVETDDLEGLRRLLQQAQALSSLGLEWLAAGGVKAGVAILEKESAKVLFRAGLSLVGRLVDATVAEFKRHGLPEAEAIEKALRTDKRGLAIHSLEQSLLEPLGFERLELLKGLLNRFPVRPVSVTKDGEGMERVLFEPVSSLAALGRLAAAVDGLTGLLHLASLTGSPLGSAVLDRRLTTGLARVLTGGTFTATPLADAEVARLGSLPREALQSTASDFFAGVEGTLRMALAPEAGRPSWAVSRVAGIHVDDPVQTVMTEFSDLVMRLVGALGSVQPQDEADLTRTLRGLADAVGKHQEAL